ncbi:MAG: hypothetical protein IH594_10820 [Bacteroidales bacterium]|nr:hypothetical protein [Bacteroidales bacterium]
MVKKTSILLFTLFVGINLLFVQRSQQYRNAFQVVSKHKLLFNAPPKDIPVTSRVDAPLMGNGSLGAAIAGPGDNLCFYLARNDFWRLVSSYNESHPCVLGKLELKFPDLAGANYKVEQDLYTAISLLRFSNTHHSIEIKTYVYAEEDLLVLEMKNVGKKVLKGELNLNTPAGEAVRLTSKMIRELDHELQVVSREFDKNVDIKTKAACALRVFGISSSGFNIEPGEKIYAVLSSSSNFKSDDCVAFVREKVNSIGEGDLIHMEDKHREWWAEYWNRSFVAINDPVIEKAYYSSLYIMGSSSRDLEFPPGIFGTWITRERPEWNGDYHMNYNHMAPFYALFSSNRLEQTMPYFSPILAFEERARRYSMKTFNIDGIYMPVGIGPKGIDVTYSGPEADSRRQYYIDHGFVDAGGLFFHQRSNALHCINNMAFLCYYTYNHDNINLVYPFIKGVLEFWESYLVFEDGRYVIYYDACYEGPNGDMNNILTLGFLRNALQTAIDMSIELNVDAEKRIVWKDILSRLSKYPTYTKKGKTYYAISEKGPFSTSNPWLWEVIYPGGQFHKDTDPEQLQIAKNSIENDIETGYLWSHELFTCFSFAVAARMGIDPDTIRTHLRNFIIANLGENGFRNESVVGIETCSMVPGAINEMYLRSRTNIIDVFPVHNKKNDAYFQDLRAEGAFLVSSHLKNGTVKYIKIFSEQGKDCNIVNPWFQKGVKTVRINRNGMEEKLDIGKRFTIKTSPDDVLIITPMKIGRHGKSNMP